MEGHLLLEIENNGRRRLAFSLQACLSSNSPSYRAAPDKTSNLKRTKLKGKDYKFLPPACRLRNREAFSNPRKKEKGKVTARRQPLSFFTHRQIF